MISNCWDSYLGEQDKAVFAALNYNVDGGYGRRPALLIVDANIAFCGAEPMPIAKAIRISRTSCGEHAWNAIPIMQQLIKTARARGVPVIYTTNSFRQDKWDAGSWNFKQKGVPHQRVAAAALNTGNDIVEPLSPGPRDIVVYKQKPSGFFGTGLASYLTLLGCDALLVAGGTTSGCVRATVTDAFSLNLRVAVASDGCFDRFEASHAISLFDMQCRYADVVASSSMVAYLDGIDEEFQLPHGTDPFYDRSVD